MSGEVVVVPALPLVAVALPVVAVAAGTVAVANGLRTLIEQREQAARRAAEREKARLAQWRRFESEQAAAMQRLDDEWQVLCAAQQRLTESGLQVPTERERRDDDEPTARGFVDSDGDDDWRQAKAQLNEVLAILRQLPEDLIGDKQLPFGRLHSQAHDWQDRLLAASMFGAIGPLLPAVESFRDTVLRTLDTYRKTLKQEEQGRQRLLKQTESLLEEALYYQHLLDDPQRELALLIDRLQQLLTRDDVTPSALHWLEQRLGALKAAGEQRLVRGLVRPALQNSLRRHLGDLGYRLLSNFPADPGPDPAQAILRIPGGECVQVTVHADGRMAFKLGHTRGTASADGLEATELERFRQQETVWCRDLRILVRRLVEEGWPCEIPFERTIPTGSIAVLETPEDWADEDGQEHSPRRNAPGRRLT